MHMSFGGFRSSPWLSVSFWELFLCAYGVKEKVDERQAVGIVCGTNP
jgi:hypothetical protein